MERIGKNQELSYTLKDLFTSELNEDILDNRLIDGVEPHEYVLKNVENQKEVANFIGLNHIKDVFEEIRLEERDYVELISSLFIIKIDLIFILLSNKYTTDELLEAIEFIPSLIKDKHIINRDIKNKDIVDEILDILFIVDFLSVSIFSKGDHSILNNKKFFKYIQDLYKNSDDIKFKSKLINTTITIDIVTKVLHLLINAFSVEFNKDSLIKLSDINLMKLIEINKKEYLILETIKLTSIEEVLDEITAVKETKFIIMRVFYLFCYIILAKFEKSDLFLKTYDKLFKS